MMQALLDFIRDVLDPIGVVVGLILAIPVFWTWWQVVFGERRWQRRRLTEISSQPGSRPGVLILDLLPGRNIDASVSRHLADDATLAAVPQDRIVKLWRDDPMQPNETIDYARKVRAASRQLLNAGCDVIHLFYAGPYVGALIAGAELSNGPRVILYHYEQGSYVNFGPLEPLRINH